jgi:hypothetical protein
MFSSAIDQVANFTRPINTILRTYGGKKVIPGSSTLFFVNEEGYAVTCKHVIESLAPADTINNNFKKFKEELSAIPRNGKFKQALKGLELKYKFQAETIVQIRNSFVDCVNKMSGFTWHLHPEHDLAILKFNDYDKLLYQGHAIFLKDDSQAKQGMFLCRLGFPFPEFSNFSYNEERDDIEWTAEGIHATPRFPIEGMITRFLGKDNKIFGIEMSTPGLRGQSGGPMFDKDGIVYGMQFSTKHLHLGFDMEEKEILVQNKLKKVTDYSFLHLGQCIHANVIKEFLKEKGVKYYEQ